MSGHELSARSRALFTQLCEEAGHRLGVERNPDVDLSTEAGGTSFNDPWIGPDEQQAVVDELRANHQRYVKEILDEADGLCRHEFPLFGMVARYGENVRWQDDPVSGKPWPSEFHTRVRIFDGNNSDHGDVKYVWELNRHQFLPVLGKAYRLTKDEKYAWAGLSLIDSWIDANPFNIGINWTSALEVAVRSLSWCWACALFEGSETLTSARRRRILGSLSQHARYIERHLSFYFSPYNHLIGEATALFVIGSLVPALRSAAHWRDRGWAILKAEMPKQYHADGGTVEQATGYHHFTLGFHLHAMLVKRHMEGDSGGRMWTDLEHAIEFSLHMMRPDGSMPMVGDGDEGKAISLVQPDLWDFRVFLALGAVLFGRGDFKKTGRRSAGRCGLAGWHERLATASGGQGEPARWHIARADCERLLHHALGLGSPGALPGIRLWRACRRCVDAGYALRRARTRRYAVNRSLLIRRTAARRPGVLDI